MPLRRRYGSQVTEQETKRNRHSHKGIQSLELILNDCSVQSVLDFRTRTSAKNPSHDIDPKRWVDCDRFLSVRLT